jgi:hypothetical protein
VAALLRATIEVISGPGQGTRFAITLNETRCQWGRDRSLQGQVNGYLA